MDKTKQQIIETVVNKYLNLEPIHQSRILGIMEGIELEKSKKEKKTA